MGIESTSVIGENELRGVAIVLPNPATSTHNTRDSGFSPTLIWLGTGKRKPSRWNHSGIFEFRVSNFQFP
jgi:hypothetical protein